MMTFRFGRGSWAVSRSSLPGAVNSVRMADGVHSGFALQGEVAFQREQEFQ
jgi:hypothetical protein